MTNPALLSTLLPAFSPCPHFSDCCRAKVQWRPESGFIPRGFAGATGTLQAVRLVLVSAEPGDPADGETYHGGPQQIAHDHMRLFESALAGNTLRREGHTTPYHRNLRQILKLCWPHLTLKEQLKRTWITNAVLCSAPKSGMAIPRAVEVTCAQTYLHPQLQLLSNAFVIALGRKAERRLQHIGVRIDASAQHPSARPNTHPVATWHAAARVFHAWIDCR